MTNLTHPCIAGLIAEKEKLLQSRLLGYLQHDIASNDALLSSLALEILDNLFSRQVNGGTRTRMSQAGIQWKPL